MSFVEFIFAGTSLLLAITLSLTLSTAYDIFRAKDRCWPIFFWSVGLSLGIVNQFLWIYAIELSPTRTNWTIQIALAYMLATVFLYLAAYAMTHKQPTVDTDWKAHFLEHKNYAYVFVLTSTICAQIARLNLTDIDFINLDTVLSLLGFALYFVALFTRNMIFNGAVIFVFLILSNILGLTAIVFLSN